MLRSLLLNPALNAQVIGPVIDVLRRQILADDTAPLGACCDLFAATAAWTLLDSQHRKALAAQLAPLIDSEEEKNTDAEVEEEEEDENEEEVIPIEDFKVRTALDARHLIQETEHAKVVRGTFERYVVNVFS